MAETIKIVNVTVFQKKLRDCFLKHREQLTDLTFVVKEKRIRASRYVISAISEVFRKMLFGDFCESGKGEIELTDCEHPDAFEFLIEFCMTGFVECPLKLAIPLLFLSEKYMVEEMKTVLSENIVKMINEDNCFDMFRIARNFSGCDNLVSQCVRFLRLNPSRTIFRQKNIGLLNKEGFEELLLLSNDKATKRSKDDELELFECIVLWSKEKDEPNFKLHASPLVLKFINFRKLSMEQILELKKLGVLDTEILFTLTLAVQLGKMDMMKETLPKECATLGTLPNSPPIEINVGEETERDKLGKETERDKLGSVDIEHLKNSGSVDTDLHVAYNSTHDGGACYDAKRNCVWSHYGKDVGGTGKKIYCTDLDTNQTKSYDIPVATHNSYPILDRELDRIYVFDDYNIGASRKDFGCVDCETGTFTKLPSCEWKRKYCYHRIIYKGGLWVQLADGYLCRYDIDKNKWEKMSNLKNISSSTYPIAFFEYEEELWIVQTSVGVYKYSPEEKKISEVWKFNIDVATNGNFIFQSFIVDGGVVFVVKGHGGNKWKLFDPINKTRTELKWAHTGANCPGHCFIKAETKEFYFNILNKWRKVLLK